MPALGRRVFRRRFVVPLARLVRLQSKPAFAQWRIQRFAETRLHLTQRHAVMRALGSCKARLHRAEIQFQRVGVFGVGRLVCAEQRVLLAIRFHEAHEALVPAREAQVVQRALVDGEKAHRRAVLGCHVRNRRAVFHRQAAQARTVELHELVHHALLAQQLRHGQHQVGRCRAFGQLAREFDAHHLRDEHVVGLSQHYGFGFDTPTPQPRMPSALIIVVWLSVPTSESGNATTSPFTCLVCTTLPRYSRFT
jgi:hypothetical protein